jgi:hypothetical protein
VRENFHVVTRNTPYSSPRKLSDFLLSLRRLGLKVHTSVAGILLPADPYFLARLIETRPAAYVSLYIRDCNKANRGAISSRFSNPKDRQVFIDAFWRVFGPSKGNFDRAAALLRVLPSFVRKDILRIAPKATLLSWFEATDLAKGVSLLQAFSSSAFGADEEGLGQLRGEAIEAVTRNVAAAAVATLAGLPLRLHQIDADADFRIPILRAGLARIIGSDDWQAVRRVIWDTYVFHPELRREAVETALSAISASPLLIPVWERFCLLGMISLDGRETPAVTGYTEEDDHLALPSTLPEDVDRWRGFLFLVGVESVGTSNFISRVPPTLVDSIEARLLAVRHTEVPASNLLIEAATKAVAALRDVAR